MTYPSVSVPRTIQSGLKQGLEDSARKNMLEVLLASACGFAIILSAASVLLALI